MATTKQKEAARKNLKKARAAKANGKSKHKKTSSNGLSTADKNKLRKSEFAFPDERKEPLTDAKHVRNAISRFDQVEGVSDKARAKAWKRIRSAAKKYDIEVSAKDWRDLFKGGKTKKH